MKSKYVLIADGLMFFLGLIAAVCGSTNFGAGLLGFSVIILPIILIIFLVECCVVHRKKRPVDEAKEARRKAQQERYEREAEARRLAKQRAKTIVEVKMLGTGATSQKRGGLGGALLGGFVAGPVGAVVGATIPTNGEQKVRFAVKYGDGRVEVKELHPNSWEYKELMKHVKWEDLK